MVILVQFKQVHTLQRGIADTCLENQVLAVVQDQQQPLAGQVIGQGGQRQARDRSCTPTAPNTAWVTGRGSRTESSCASQAPSGKPRDISAAARKASLGLPGTAAAGQGQQPGGGQQPLDLARLLLAADETGHLGRQVCHAGRRARPQRPRPAVPRPGPPC